MFWESKMRQLRKQVEALEVALEQAEQKLGHMQLAHDIHKQRMDRKLAAIEKRLDRIEGVH